METTVEERLLAALMAHRVISDGLYYGTGWCETCGNLDDDSQEAHQAKMLEDLVEDLAENNDAYHNLLMKQGNILTGVANALRGDPPPLTHWSHHDLAERAATAKAEAWDEAAEAYADWIPNQSTPAGIPVDPPLNPYDKDRP